MSDEQQAYANDEGVTGHEAETQPDSPEARETEASPEIDLEKVRDLVLAAYPDVVREMIHGESFDDLMASVEPARAAYQRIANEAIERAAAQPATPRVAAQPGRRGAEIIDIDTLSPLGKISEGLRRI